MNILITGSSGHLGEALVRVLRKTNHLITGIDVRPSEFTDAPGSITDRDFVNQHIQNKDIVFHTATLHKPHMATHCYQQFIDTNISGTLNLLEEATREKVRAFIFTSTTSVFGDALTPKAGANSAWITEEVASNPKNIYGVTKEAAENLCHITHKKQSLPCIILRTSRFFPEEDDKKEMRKNYADANIKANELLYRRVDLHDLVDAHLLAMEKAPKIGFGKYIVSASTPFTESDIERLNTNATEIVSRIYPNFPEIYNARGWKMFPAIDRVYVNRKARQELGWQPKYSFEYALDCLKKGKDFQSPLAHTIGSKGYHDQEFEEAPYPVDE